MSYLRGFLNPRQAPKALLFAFAFVLVFHTVVPFVAAAESTVDNPTQVIDPVVDQVPVDPPADVPQDETQDTTEPTDETPADDTVDQTPAEDTSEEKFDLPVQLVVPEGIQCVNGAAWAASVDSSSQGTLNDGSPIIDPARTNPNAALGAPDNSFFSIGKGGEVVVQFAGYVIDTEGTDLSFHEITNGRPSYPEERADIEVSQDGSAWFPIGSVSGLDNGTGVSLLDFSSTGLPWIKYVKISDSTDFTIHNEQADGYDLDAVDATEESCAIVEMTKNGVYGSVTGAITYTIHWSVVGTGGIDNLTITDVVPSGLTFVSASAPGIFDGIDTITWDLGPQAGGNSGDVTFDATLDAALAMNQWANLVVSSNQGLQADLINPVDVSRQDPNQALGVAETTGTPYDNPIGAYSGKFFSLGFNQDETGGNLTVQFAQPVFNGVGDDLKVWEVTSGDNYPDEEIKVEVSNDNSNWTDIGLVVRDGSVDLGSFGPTASYVRVTGTSDRTLFAPDADNYDVDAIQALHRMPDLCSVVNTATGRWSYTQQELSFTVTASTETIINENSCGGGEDGLRIAGKVYDDKDNNNDFDGSDVGLPDWTVNLDDLNDESAVLATKLTDSNGDYEFTGLPGGCYHLTETLQNGWSQTEPNVTNHDYYIALGGAKCDFGEVIVSAKDKDFVDSIIGSVIKTAQAAGDSVAVFVAGDAVGLDFGNFSEDSGGCVTNCGGGGGGSRGNGSNDSSDDNGQVLGDVTNTPSDQGQVLGDATTLPRTGNSAVVLLLIGLLLSPMIFTVGLEKRKN